MPCDEWSSRVESYKHALQAYFEAVLGLGDAPGLEFNRLWQLAERARKSADNARAAFACPRVQTRLHAAGGRASNSWSWRPRILFWAIRASPAAEDRALRRFRSLLAICRASCLDFCHVPFQVVRVPIDHLAQRHRPIF